MKALRLPRRELAVEVHVLITPPDWVSHQRCLRSDARIFGTWISLVYRSVKGVPDACLMGLFCFGAKSVFGRRPANSNAGLFVDVRYGRGTEALWARCDSPPIGLTDHCVTEKGFVLGEQHLLYEG